MFRRSSSDPRMAPYVSRVPRSMGDGGFGRVSKAMRSRTEMDEQQVSATLIIPGVTSYLSIHCSTSKGGILTISEAARKGGWMVWEIADGCKRP